MRQRLHVTLGALLSAVILVAGCSGGEGDSGSDQGEIRFSWWGNPDRAEITEKAVKLFEEKNPGITVKTDFAEYEAYWQKMATETAGGGGPDVMQMDYSYLKQYGQRNIIADLKPHAESGALDLKGIDESLAKTGELGGKLVGVPMAGNVLATFYRPDILDKAGVEEPKAGEWTWDDVHQAIRKITEAEPEKDMTGAADYTNTYHFMDIWLRQRGKSFYTGDGRLGFTQDDLRAWWNRTMALRDDKVVLSPERAEQLDPNPPISAGAVAIEFRWDNFFARYVEEDPDNEYAIGPMPMDDPASSGLYTKPSMLLSVTSKTAHPEAAAKLVDFLVNDPEAAKILGTNRGIPAAKGARDAVEMNDVDQAIFNYQESVADLLQDPPPPPPPGAGTIEQAMLDITEEINYKRITVDEAVDRFFTEAGEALEAGAD